LHLRGRRPALAALALALFPSAAIGAGVRTDFRVVPSFFTGDFGGSGSTDLYFVPLIFTARGSRNDFRITVPYLSIKSDDLVAIIGGQVIPIGMGTTTESGLGDIVLRDDFFYLPGGDGRPWLYATARLKFPTGDETRGLGSGEFDYGPGAGIILPVGNRLNLLGEAIYMVRGDPPGLDFHNTWWGFIGGESRLSDSDRLSLYYDRRESVVSGSEDIASLILGYSHAFTETLILRSFATAGLTETAEDYGFGLGLVFREDSRRFP
jgi:hypothetical protein